MVILKKPETLQNIDYSIVKKKEPHYCIIYSKLPVTTFRIVLLNDLKLLSDQYIIAESKTEKEINDDLLIFEEFITPMLDSLSKAEVKNDTMTKEQLRDLLLGVKETASKTFPSKQQEENTFITSMKKENDRSNLDSIESVSDFVKKIEDYSIEISKLKKRAECLKEYMNGSRAEKYSKKVKQTIEKLNKMESEIESYIRKTKRMSKKDINRNESYLLEKTNKQYETCKETVKSILTPEINHFLRNRESKISKSEKRDSNDYRNESSKSKNYRVQETRSKKFSFDESPEDKRFNMLQQQILSGEKAYISNSALSTIEVEKQIAREKIESLEKIEDDFNELMEINQNMNQLIKEDQALFNSIETKVHKTNQHIEKGNQSLKQAKNSTIMSFLSGRFLS